MISSSIKPNKEALSKIMKKINDVSKTKDKENKLKEKKEKEEIKKYMNELQVKWQYLMGQLGKFNKFRKSFGLNNIRCTDYGFAVDIYAPSALSLDELEIIKPYIETEFSCEFIYKIKYNSNKHKYADAKFINPEKVKCNSIPFTPHPVKAYEVYTGINVAGQPIIKNVNTHSHILICGATRRGKNGGLDHILTSWIHYCSEKEIQLYLFQCAKTDLKKYQSCKQVYGYTENLVEMYYILEHILEDMKRKSKLIEPMLVSLKGDNIYDYNLNHPYNKLPYTYVVIDEFLALTPEESDSKEVKLLKLTIQDKLRAIGQFGGSVGTNFLISHQKPEKQYCPSFLKNMSNIRICFGFNDAICSQIVLGNDMAVGLPPRKAIVYDGEDFEYIYTTDLRGRIEKYIKSSIQLNHRTIFDDFKKMGIEISSPSNNDKNKSNSNTNSNTQTPPQNSGKEEVSYEQLLKQKEQELKAYEDKLKKQQEAIERMAIKLKSVNEKNIKDTYEKVMTLPKTPEQILEENKKKNPNWVEWTPPPQTGKEIVK